MTLRYGRCTPLCSSYLEKKLILTTNIAIFDFSDVYGFLSTPSTPVSTAASVADVIQGSSADASSGGLLSDYHAAKVICLLSQQVDR